MLAGFVSALALALGNLTAGAAAPPQYRLRWGYRPGDRYLVEILGNLTMDFRAPGLPEELTVVGRQRERYTEEILAINALGPTSLRRTYTIARVYQATLGIGETTISPLQGKTVLIRRQGNRTLVRATKGLLPPNIRQELASELEYLKTAFFPKEPVGPGDEWSADDVAKLLAKDLAGTGDVASTDHAEVRCRFEEVVPYAGRQCALIHTQIIMAGKLQDGGRVDFQVEGPAYHALDLQQTLSMKLTGPFHMEGEMKEGGMRGKVSGKGTLTLTETRKVLRTGREAR